jgi:anti-sigma B factor antagonist
MSAKHSGPFDVSVTRRPDGIARVSVHGEIDVATVPALQLRLRDLRGPGSHVVLDLDGVAFMDSAGLRVIVDEHRAAAAGGWRFSLSGGSQDVRRLIDIAGLTPHVRYVDLD